MKRYCQTLELINDPFLLAEFEDKHQHIWPEVVAEIKQAGILDIQIFRYENVLFMIIDAQDNFDWETDAIRLGNLPYQKLWDLYISKYKKINPRDPDFGNWKTMHNIFTLNSKNNP